MAAIEEEHVRFAVENVMCEGVLAYPSKGAPKAAAVVFAPHPLLGGNMDNNVVAHVWRRAAHDGAVSLRFNYRGIGGSGITLPAGLSTHAWFDRVELQRNYAAFLPECAAALAYLRGVAAETAPCTVVGYSLGAVLAGLLAPNPATTRLIAVSPPNARVPMDVFRRLGAPKLFVGSDNDPFFDKVAFLRDFADFPEPKKFIAFGNGDHFFRGDEERLYQSLQAWLLAEEVPR